MGSAVLFVAGPTIWIAELKQTRNGSPMRGVLVAVDNGTEGQEPACPPVFIRLFGSDAEHVKKGDHVAAEGTLEAEVGERDGKSVVRLSIMARWSRLTGHAGDRQRRSKAAKRGAEQRKGGGHQTAVDFQAPTSGPPDYEPPAFDDEIPFG